MKKIISLILSMALLFSLCVPAMAEDAVPQFENFLVIGDSIPAGYGLKYYDENEFKFVEDSYPAIVKEAIHAEDGSFNASHLGMRVRDALCMLSGDLRYADDFTTEFFNTVNYGGEQVLENKLWKWKDEEFYNEKIRSADLIAVNLGNNDIMGSLFYIILRLIRSMAETDESYRAMYEGVMELFSTLGFQDSTIDFLMIFVQESLKTQDEYDSFLDALKMVIEQNGISEFIESWDVLMEKIVSQKKPTARVVVMNVYNPGFAIFGGDETNAREDLAANIVNEFFQLLVDGVNYEIEYGSAYRDQYVVVDTSGVTAYLEAGYTPENLHPGPDAHAYLAQQLLAALNDFCEHRHTVTLFKRNASIFHDGYSGDLVCADCGVLLEQGRIVKLFAKDVELPKGAGYALITYTLRTVFDNVSRLFGSITQKAVR